MSVLRLCGLTKAEIESGLQKYVERGLGVTVDESYLDARVEFSIYDGSQNRLAMTTSYIANEFKDYLYSTTDESLEQMCLKLLKHNNLVLSTAESLTGGMVSSRITSVPGASDCFFEGIVCYDTLAKVVRCRVSRQTIDRVGAVSKQTAYEMVRGLLVGKTTIALSTTGVAGPSPSEGKKVGLVYIGVGRDNFIPVFEHNFTGDRQEIREKTTNMALFYLVRYLQGNILLL